MAQYSTIQEFIDMGESNKLTYYNLSITSKVDDMIYSVENVIYDYIDELKGISETVELSDAEMLKYACNPELLAYHIYGSEELAFIILAVNDMPAGSGKEFTNRRIKLIPKEVCLYALNTIYNKETNYINYSRELIKQ